MSAEAKICDPDLSVVLTNYNHAELLPRSIESILSQEFWPGELLIVDDCSTDTSVEVIEQYTAKYPFIRLHINQRNLGPGEAMNVGAAMVSGRYLARAAADDWFLPAYFSRGMRMARRYPNAGLIFGQMQCVDGDGKLLETYGAQSWSSEVYITPEDYFHKFVAREPATHSLGGATLVRRDAFLEHGGYLMNRGFTLDTLTLWAIGLKYGACYVPTPFTAWRKVAGSASVSNQINPSQIILQAHTAAEFMTSENFRDLFPLYFVSAWARDWMLARLRGMLRKVKQSSGDPESYLAMLEQSRALLVQDPARRYVTDQDLTQWVIDRKAEMPVSSISAEEYRRQLSMAVDIAAGAAALGGESQGPTVDEFLMRAQRAKITGDLSAAAHILQEAIVAFPQNARPLYELGVVAYDAKNYDVAASVLSMATERDHTLIDAWNYLSEALFELGRYDEASDIFETLAKSFGDQPAVVARAAEMAQAAGRAEIAKQLLTKLSHASDANPLMSAESVVFNGESFEVEEVIASGTTSAVYRISGGRIIKALKENPRNIFEREIFWLRKLAGEGISPELLGIDEAHKMLMMEDVGEPVSADTLPRDWTEQLGRILDVMAKFNCRHNDLSHEEVLVREGRLKIVDFGWASLGTDFSCGAGMSAEPKKRIFYDADIVNSVEFFLSESLVGAELHCFVLWKTEDEAKITPPIENSFKVVRRIKFMPAMLDAMPGGRMKVLNDFYRGQTATHGDKAEQPFLLYILLDEDPIYEVRTNKSRGTSSVVNVKTFDLKNRLRGDRKQYLHSTCNLEETHDNLRALTFYENNIPFVFWEKWRPQFSSMSEWFAVLNADPKLEYVILRNFDNYPIDHRVDEHGDIDILVNDYFRLKGLSGGKAFKHLLPETDKKFGPAVEDGGYKVANYVNFEGRDVIVDIRHLGDNYYDINWERDMLASRVKYKGFYVLDQEDYFYSLLYHALAHKTKVSDTYFRKFLQLSPKLKLGLSEESVKNVSLLWDILDVFMRRRGYTYVRPNELNIPFNVRGIKS